MRNKLKIISDIIYLGQNRRGNNSELVKLSISGEIVKETAKQLVILDEKTQAKKTINKNKIIDRYDYLTKEFVEEYLAQCNKELNIEDLKEERS